MNSKLECQKTRSPQAFNNVSRRLRHHHSDESATVPNRAVAVVFLLLSAMVGIGARTYNDPETYTIVGSIPSGLRLTESAQYSCVFHNKWSGLRHPRLYPGSEAHWSSPILASHNDGYTMWECDHFASKAVEKVAENGDNRLLQGELDRAHILYVNDHVEGKDQYNVRQESQTLPNIQVTNFHPLLSSMSMIACSPDWFSGFNNLDMRNIETDTWYEIIQIQTYPFDAGTEDGDEFKCTNSATSPQNPITQLTVDTIPTLMTTGVFLNSDGKTVLPVAEWTCTLQNVPECHILGKECVTGLECCSKICVPFRRYPPSTLPSDEASPIPTVSEYPTSSVYPTSSASPASLPSVIPRPTMPTLPSNLIPGICA